LNVIYKLASSGVGVPIDSCAYGIELAERRPFRVVLLLTNLQCCRRTLDVYRAAQTECMMVHNLSWILQHILAATGQPVELQH